MGRPRVPSAVKRLRGTWRADRANERAPRPVSIAVPAPPRELSAVERAVWKRLAREIPPGVFTTADGTAFRALVRAVAMAENPPENMSESARINWSKHAQSMLGRFGLTPADREKVSAAASDAPDRDAEDEFTGLRVVE